MQSDLAEGKLTRDKQFVEKIMKVDPRDRPTAGELLQDQRFTEVEE
jgi:hypothetical protein